jgi:hypothetical protein
VRFVQNLVDPLTKDLQGFVVENIKEDGIKAIRSPIVETQLNTNSGNSAQHLKFQDLEFNELKYTICSDSEHHILC